MPRPGRPRRGAPAGSSRARGAAGRPRPRTPPRASVRRPEPVVGPGRDRSARPARRPDRPRSSWSTSVNERDRWSVTCVARREVAQVRVRRAQPGVHRADRVGVGRPGRAHVDDAAVGEQDVGLPMLRVRGGTSGAAASGSVPRIVRDRAQQRVVLAVLVARIARSTGIVPVPVPRREGRPAPSVMPSVMSTGRTTSGRAARGRRDPVLRQRRRRVERRGRRRWPAGGSRPAAPPGPARSRRRRVASQRPPASVSARSRSAR